MYSQHVNVIYKVDKLSGQVRLAVIKLLCQSHQLRNTS